jgi:hypothetical protein
MYRRDDPRLRRRLDQLGHTVEAATEQAQENLYTFSQRYVAPCFSSIGNCMSSCTEACFPHLDRRRPRGQTRGRAEASFDFYDDWDEEENDALLGWGNGNDELNRLLAGSGSTQPGRERGMNYGTRRETPRIRRKSLVQGESPDPNVIPASNYLGFMERIIGRRGLRYKPSAADLQEHPGAHRVTPEEQEVLIEDSDEDGPATTYKKHRRVRSSTATSGHTTSSLSSRGDLFPSDDEDDAVPLDDEFAMALERRTTGSGPDEGSSRKTRSAGSKSRSRLSTRTVSTKSLQSPGRKASGSRREEADVHTVNVPTLSELQAEEERVHREEEALVEEKRIAAKKLAQERGLKPTESKPVVLRSPSPSRPSELDSKSPASTGMFPFPAFDPPTAPTTPREEFIATFNEPSQFEVSDPIPIIHPPTSSQSPVFVPAALPHFSQSLD